MKIAITSDSTIDITKELLQKFDIKTIPVSILLDDKDILDGEMTNAEIFEYVDKTGVLPKTSAINEESFKEFFSEVLKEYDAIIHFDISSNISSMYANACNAAKNFGDKIEVIDSRVLSSAIGLLAITCRKLTKKMDDIHKIAEIIRSKTDKVQASFVIEKLDYLKKGGRCSSIALLGANLMKIRPQIVLTEGTMKSAKKYRGPMPIVVKQYCKDVLAETKNINKDLCFITYSSTTPEMLEAAYSIVNEFGFSEVYETIAGGTVASHCGGNTLGILFMADAE